MREPAPAFRADLSPLALAIGEAAAAIALAGSRIAWVLALHRRPFVMPNAKLERVTDGR